MPTLINHALLANGLSILINERASIIDSYRKNILTDIEGATAALGEKSADKTDLTTEWKVVQGIGMTASIVPQAAPVGAAITLVGWLGEQFVKEISSTKFSHGPHDVAVELYGGVEKMKGALDSSEQAYLDEVGTFRTALNDVPSTFLELYDLTENKVEKADGCPFRTPGSVRSAAAWVRGPERLVGGAGLHLLDGRHELRGERLRGDLLKPTRVDVDRDDLAGRVGADRGGAARELLARQ